MMSRPTRLIIDKSALLHNLNLIKKISSGAKIVTMLKANAYGSGVQQIAPVLDGKVEAFGVASIEEALVIHNLGCQTSCVLFQGVFSADEFKIASELGFSSVIHQPHQLKWLLENSLSKPLKIWVKVDTGMHRLGFPIDNLAEVMHSLKSCPWVDKDIGLMTHLACADEPEREENIHQIERFKAINVKGFTHRSIANSAAILSFPQTHEDVVRPGVMLYGVSPFADKDSIELGLRPVMQFVSAVSAVSDIAAAEYVGYGGIWKSHRPSRIAIVAAGYGDGYPRHINPNTPVWIEGQAFPIVGRVSMDMLAVDITDCPFIKPGTPVELWGKHILVEQIARCAHTSSYELLCQISERVRHL